MLIHKDQPQDALLKAKEAETQMKALQDLITTQSLEDVDFKSVKFTVFQILADAYKANAMWDDALHRYQRIIKDRDFMYPHLIYFEIGSIYLKMGKYSDAVKNYEMAINHLHANSTRLAGRFYHCCGIAHIKQGDFTKALSNFENAMTKDPNVKTGFNLVLCHSILSPLEQLKNAYTRLLAIKPYSTPDANESDILGNQQHVERREEIRLIMLASRLVASKSEKDWQESYEFVLQSLKKSKFPEAAGEFEIAYSLAYLQHHNAPKAIDMLRQIRKKDPSLMALAATNLSFLYFIEQQYENAEKYADIALSHDRFNAQAHVNKGNCLVQA